MKPKISVIVPVYKVLPYLSKCIESIIHQTYSNLEIIIIDDGSPDECPAICDEYASHDNRITVLHTENRGLSAARNNGLDIATGDYIMFVDSDDWLELNMIEVLYNNIKEYCADIAVVAYKGELMGENSMLNDNQPDIITFDKWNEIYCHLLPAACPTLAFMVWNKLFTRDVISDTRFPVGKLYEDMSFDRAIFRRCNKVVYSSWIGYHYRIGRQGSTATFFRNVKMEKFGEIMRFIDELKEVDDIRGIAAFSNYGCNTAIELYYSAWSNNIDFQIRKEIRKWFNYFRKNEKDLILSPDFISSRVKRCLFNISPIIYCYLYKTYNYLRKKF